jgi:hypothetical protein
MLRKLRRSFSMLFGGAVAFACVITLLSPFGAKGQEQDRRDFVQLNAQAMIDQGRRIFRFDTFGNEAFWGHNFGCTKPLPERTWEVSVLG